MSSLVQKEDKNDEYILFVKGAAELILDVCTKVSDPATPSGVPMSDEEKRGIQNYINELAHRSLRTICIAHAEYKEVDVTRAEGDLTQLEKNLVLDAIYGIKDPLRSDVPDAVRTCQRAGITVRMVTGDNANTARAIARECGILENDEQLVLEGPEFRKMTPAQVDTILPSLRVLARSSPNDKHIIVSRLNGKLPATKESWEKEHPGHDWDTEKDSLLPGYREEWEKNYGDDGEIVGVTGDGTNDAPALKIADVGLSMGISGTEVAKEASDIVIMDDNFSSIVKSVLWGRSVFDNIRKFIQFQLTVNVVALVITFLSAISGYEPPLNTVMMLWVNLIMDTMGALALGTEAPDPSLLLRVPYSRSASLISISMIRHIFIQSIYQIGVLLILLLKIKEYIVGFEGKKDFIEGGEEHLTIVFNTFVICQIFNEFNARSITDDIDILKGLGKNPMFQIIIVFTVIVQYLIVEYGGDFTKTVPLDWGEWKTCICLGAFTIPLGILMRLIPVSDDDTVHGWDGHSTKKNVVKMGYFVVIVVAPLVIAYLIKTGHHENLTNLLQF